jgi:hypothetical protein
MASYLAEGATADGVPAPDHTADASALLAELGWDADDASDTPAPA